MTEVEEFLDLYVYRPVAYLFVRAIFPHLDHPRPNHPFFHRRRPGRRRLLRLRAFYGRCRGGAVYRLRLARLRRWAIGPAQEERHAHGPRPGRGGRLYHRDRRVFRYRRRTEAAGLAGLALVAVDGRRGRQQHLPLDRHRLLPDPFSQRHPGHRPRRGRGQPQLRRRADRAAGGRTPAHPALGHRRLSSLSQPAKEDGRSGRREGEPTGGRAGRNSGPRTGRC